MSETGLSVFDKTLQLTNTWLDEIMKDVGPDRQVAWHSLEAVLHALRDRLSPEMAAHLGAQLPLLVRGAYYDQYQPAATPDTARSLDDFLQKIGTELRPTRPVDPRLALESVCAVLDHHVAAGQMEKVYNSLPKDIRRAVVQERRPRRHHAATSYRRDTAVSGTPQSPRIADAGDAGGNVSAPDET